MGGTISEKKNDETEIVSNLITTQMSNHFSFLPPSVMEQLQLACSPEEVNLAIGEVIDIYLCLNAGEKLNCRSEIAPLLRDLLQTRCREDKHVVLRILEFMKLLAQDHVHAFISESHSICNELQKHLSDARKEVRQSALLLAIRLIDILPFASSSSGFVLSCALDLPSRDGRATDEILDLVAVYFMSPCLGECQLELLQKYRKEECAMSPFTEITTNLVGQMSTLLSTLVESVTNCDSFTPSSKEFSGHDLLVHEIFAISLLLFVPMEVLPTINLNESNPAIEPNADTANVLDVFLFSQFSDEKTNRPRCLVFAQECEFKNMSSSSTLNSRLQGFLSRTRSANRSTLSPRSFATGSLSAKTASVSASPIPASPSRANTTSAFSRRRMRAKYSSAVGSDSALSTGDSGSSGTDFNGDVLDGQRFETSKKELVRPGKFSPGDNTPSKFNQQQVPGTSSLSYTPSWEDLQSSADASVSRSAKGLSRTSSLSRVQSNSSIGSKIAIENGTANERELSRSPSNKVLSRVNSNMLKFPWSNSTESSFNHPLNGLGNSSTDSVESVHEAVLRSPSKESLTSLNLVDCSVQGDVPHRPPRFRATPVKQVGEESCNTARSLDSCSSFYSCQSPSSKSSMVGGNNSLSDANMFGGDSEYEGIASIEPHSQTTTPRKPVSAFSTPARAKGGRRRGSHSNDDGTEQTDTPIRSSNTQFSQTRTGDGDSVGSGGIVERDGSDHDEEFDPKFYTGASPLQKRKASVSRTTSFKSNGLATVSETSPSVTGELDLQIPNCEDGIEGVRIESIVYLSTEELQPFPNANKEIARVAMKLEKAEWPEVFDLLNAVRQLAVHHAADWLSSNSSMNVIRMGVLKQTDNLRSAVVKNALLTIADVCLGLGKHLDAELPGIAAVLLKKCGDTNNFLGETADFALNRLVDHSTASRALAGLILGCDHKNATVRAKTAMFLYLLVSNRGGELKGCREMDALRTKLSKLMSDHSPEARQYARGTVRMLVERQVLTREELEQFLTSDQIEKSVSSPLPGDEDLTGKRTIASSSPKRSFSSSPRKGRALQSNSRIRSASSQVGSPLVSSENLKPDGVADASSPASPRQVYQSGAKVGGRPVQLTVNTEHSFATGGDSENPLSVASAKKSSVRRTVSNGVTPSSDSAQAKKIFDSTPCLQALNDTIRNATAKGWNERQQALTDLTDVIIRYGGVLRELSKMESCLDAILERLGDGSPKVALHSLQCVQHMICNAASLLCHFSQLVLPALIGADASTNKQISLLARSVLLEYMKNLSTSTLVQQLCSIALHEKDRLRASAFRLLAENMKQFWEARDGLAAQDCPVKKFIFPALRHALFGGKGAGKQEVRLAVVDALKAVQEAVGVKDPIWLWVEDVEQQNEIRRVTTLS